MVHPSRCVQGLLQPLRPRDAHTANSVTLANTGLGIRSEPLGGGHPQVPDTWGLVGVEEGTPRPREQGRCRPQGRGTPNSSSTLGAASPPPRDLPGEQYRVAAGTSLQARRKHKCHDSPQGRRRSKHPPFFPVVSSTFQRREAQGPSRARPPPLSSAHTQPAQHPGQKPDQGSALQGSVQAGRLGEDRNENCPWIGCQLPAPGAPPGSLPAALRSPGG